MNPDPPSLESSLRGLTPSALDDALLDRLEACTDGSLTTLTPTELQFESSLRDFQPSALPADILASLESIVADVPFARDEKVVFFPKAGAASGKVRTFPRPMWAAAAAVAFIGAASALFLPDAPRPTPVAKETKVSTAPVLPGVPNIASAAYDPSEARDEGVIWHADDQPRRVLRVLYNEVVIEKDAAGNSVQKIYPQVKYILIPETAD
ncbi:MAG: hypothetical protein QM627_07640 [Luteolibacter sp.]